MPELPEVETVKNEISPYILGHQITGIDLLWEGIVREPSPQEFKSRVIGQKVENISRRGKYLMLCLSSGDILVIHLKMTGSLLVNHDFFDPPQYTRAVIHLDNGSRIFFRDPRKFGLMQLVEDKECIIGKLGPEPLEEGFTPKVLAEILDKRTTPVKALLTDQNIIAGIGNMYADEALFVAKIHPLRTAGSLSRQAIQRLHQAIIQVLQAGIAHHGASTDTYIRPNGTLGTAHDEFKVAHRRGQRCLVCDTPIQRIVVRGRGTYFCPKCQPAKTRNTTK